jgi:polysaccharide pyruvyl transferase WcaK-like protein
LLIQASAQGADSDLATARELQRRVPDLGVLNPFALGAQHHPVDAVVGAIGLAHAVAAVRYHTAVLRLIAGRQAFSLHYSNKGQDLARRLGMPGMDLAALDPAEAVRGIEASAQAAFDPVPQRQHVRQSFASAMQCAQVGAKVA